MKTFYFDCQSGVSGDMTLGALLDLGVEPDYLKSELEKLNLPGYHLEFSRRDKQGISAFDVDVVLEQQPEEFYTKEAEQTLANDFYSISMELDHDYAQDLIEEKRKHSELEVVPLHEHKHEGHEHSHEHPHEEGHAHHHHHHHEHTHRNLPQIMEIINKSGITAGAKELAAEIFGKLARAEAKVHGKAIDEVHFHEVGAVDSIVDIVGTAICIDFLKPEKIVFSPLREGTGMIQCAHGMLPVPVPATAEVLAFDNVPVELTKIQGEMVTPTGAAIAAALADEFSDGPVAGKLLKVGYGAGKKDFPHSNVLRVMLLDAEQKEAKFPPEELALLETNIDDSTAEVLGYTADKLLENGALDVWFTPIQMKKFRPGVMLCCLCRGEQKEKLGKIIMEETSTLGIRVRAVERLAASREEVTVKTPFGEIKGKRSVFDGITKTLPEYESAKEAAKRQGLPLQRIYEAFTKSL